MSFIDNIKTPGRELIKRVRYRKNGNTDYLDDEKFVSAKLGFNYGILDGTICKWLQLELTEDLGLNPTTDFIGFTIYAKANNTNYDKSFGTFYLKDATPKYDANTKTYIYELYDGMLKAMIPYVPITATYPLTCQQYFNKVVQALGWSTTIQLSVTGSKQLDNDYYDGLNYTYRDILSDLLQANGILAYFDNNVLKATSWLNNNTPTVIIDDDILKNVNVNIGKKFGVINSLTLSRASDTDKISYKDDASISVNGLTNLTITDNQILNGEDRATYLQALFNRFSGYEWYLCDAELTGYGGFNLMQKVRISTNGNTYDTYVFNNEIEVDSAYNEKIYVETEEQQVASPYTYTDDDRKAEIIVDKKIGEVDIRGKAIKLTADDITIESNNFNVDTDGNLLCNEATMRGATFTGGDVTLYEDTSISNHTPLKIYENDIIQTLTLNDSYSLYRVKINLPSSGYLSSSENFGLTPFLKFENNDFEIQYRYSHSNNVEWLDEVRLNKNTNEVKYIDLWYRDADEIKVATQPTIIDATMTCTLYSNSYTGLLDRLTYVLTTTSGTTKLSANKIYTENVISYNDNYYFHSLPTSGAVNTNMNISLLETANINVLGTGSIYVGGRDIFKQKLLKAPGWIMNATQTVNLDENVSAQPNGIVLVWSAYRNGATQDSSWHCFYIPKYMVATKPGNGYTFTLADSKFAIIGTKYVYIHNDRISGHADNTASGTSSATNIKYNNGGWVLRYVVGV